MPCYTAWNEDLSPGTPDYLKAESKVHAKLKAVQHIVDYYYKAFEHSLPDVPISMSIDPFRQPKSNREMRIREMICHHFSCDGIHFCTLYDVCSLLDAEDKGQRAYLAVILPCANLIRANGEKYRINFQQ